MARVLVAACIAIASVLVLTSMGAEAEETRSFDIGDNWVYDIEMDMDDMSLTGTYTVSIDEISTTSVAGVTYDTYTGGFDGDLLISGDIEGVTVEGSATYSGALYIDMATIDEVKSDANLSMDVEMEYLGLPYEFSTWSHDIITYSPPGGTGEEPEDPEEGDTWVMTLTQHIDSTSFDGTSITTESDSNTVTVSYLYVGLETITVPAGTFDCEVIQEDDGEDIETTWYCEEVGAMVKSVEDSDLSMSVTFELTSYEYTPEGSGDSMTLYIVLGAVVAVVVVAVVVVLVLMKRKKPVTPQPLAPVPAQPTDQQPPAPPPGSPPGPQ